MKNIFTFLLSALIGLTAFATDGAGRVMVSFYGNNDYHVYIDGKSIYSNSNRVYLNNMRPGRHSIEVYDSKRNNRRKNKLVYSSSFVVRPQYDMNIIVDRNGYVRFDEDRNYNKNNKNDREWNNRDRNNRDWDDYDRNKDWDRNKDYDRDRGYEKNRDYDDNKGWDNHNMAMNDADFNRFVQNIRNQWFSKLNTAKTGLNDHYFTSYQVRQVLQMFSSENDKLELAKTAYRRTVDPRNFSQLYDLFSSQGRTELERYVREERY